MRMLLILLVLPVTGTLLAVLVGAAVNAVDRDLVLRPSRDGTARLFREWAAHLALGPLGIWGWLDSAPSPARTADDTQVPVLLVHGYGLNRGCMLPLQAFLRAHGWRWAWAMNLRPRGASIPDQARSLARSVATLQRVSGCQQVDIVAHSLGGVVSGWYVNQMNGAASVRSIITLGTPWQGTRMHVFALRRAGRDLAAGSDVIAQVTHPRVPVTSIWSHCDQLVNPTTSARPDWVRSVELPQLSHNEMLFNARAMRAVAESLRLPEAPDDV